MPFSPYTVCLLFRTWQGTLNVSDPLFIYGCPFVLFFKEYVQRMHNMTKDIRNCKREIWCRSLDWPGHVAVALVPLHWLLCWDWNCSLWNLALERISSLYFDIGKGREAGSGRRLQYAWKSHLENWQHFNFFPMKISPVAMLVFEPRSYWHCCFSFFRVSLFSWLWMTFSCSVNCYCPGSIAMRGHLQFPL